MKRNDKAYRITASYYGSKITERMATQLGAEIKAAELLSQGFGNIRTYLRNEEGNESRIDTVPGVIGLPFMDTPRKKGNRA